MKTILKNLSYIATFDDRESEIRDADIAINSRQIDAIGTDLPTHDADCVIDGNGLLATPGLINAHQHLYQASLRTIPGSSVPACPRFLRRRTPSPFTGGEPGASVLLSSARLRAQR